MDLENVCDKLKEGLRPYVKQKYDLYKGVSNFNGVEGYDEIRLETSLNIIASSWSEVLRWAYKDEEKVELSDCLMPKSVPKRARKAWDVNISRLCFSQDNVEDILRDYGRDKDTIDLPFGARVIRECGKYFLGGK
jgi:hypothetical protein